MFKVILSAVLLFGLSAQAERNPVGEKVKYKLDNSRARTTSMIKKGWFTAEVTEYLPDAANGPAFNTKLTYDLTISWVGRKVGTKELEAPEQYFRPEFLEQLRSSKTMDLGTFKVAHKGFATVSTMNGKRYRNCDKILIHDIKNDPAEWSGFVRAAVHQITQVTGVAETEIKNLKILAHVKSGIAVLGAVKIDISGQASGFDFKAGFDLL